MKTILLGAAATVLVAGSAIAADMPVFKARPPVVYDWAGFYVGVGIGARADLVDASIGSASIGTPATPLNTPAQCEIALGIGQSCPNGAALDRGQFRGTIYGGYNWQWRQWVVGIEVDAGTARRTQSVVGHPYPGFIAGIGLSAFGSTAADSFSVETSWDASIRGRLGWAASQWVLVYVTGGAEWLHAGTTSTCSIGPNGAAHQNCSSFGGAGVVASPASISHSTDRPGATVGGGLEARLFANVIIRGEYRYANFGTVNFTDVRTVTSAANPFVVNYSAKITEHVATIGISYLWGGAGSVSASY
jgi:outer membrane immunogenic protein